MKKSLRRTALLLFLLLPGSIVCADENDIRDQLNPVVTAVTPLSIAPDARAGGMGDVGAATDPDVHSQYWNPAKYPFTMSRAGLSVNDTPWLRQLTDGIALADLSGYVRLGDYQALSASLRYFTMGDVMTEDAAMTVKPYEMAVDVAYSRMRS